MAKERGAIRRVFDAAVDTVRSAVRGVTGGTVTEGVKVTRKAGQKAAIARAEAAEQTTRDKRAAAVRREKRL